MEPHMNKHTDGGLRLHDMERATIVAGKPGGEIANCLNGFGDQEANAARIVLTWNCHDELLEACREAASRLRYSGDLFHDQGNEMRAKADWAASEKCLAAIAKAQSPSIQTGEDK